jgi:hypothetical protein
MVVQGCAGLPASSALSGEYISYKGYCGIDTGGRESWVGTNGVSFFYYSLSRGYWTIGQECGSDADDWCVLERLSRCARAGSQ